MDRIVLLPNRNAVLERKIHCAMAEASDSFGTVISTPLDYLRELWDLFGSPFGLVNQEQRFAALFLAAKESRPPVFCSANSVRILSRLADFALGTPEFDGASDLSQAPLLDCLCVYERILHEKGLVDPARAYAELAERQVVVYPVEVDATSVELTPSQRKFFLSQDSIDVIECEASRCLDGFIQPEVQLLLSAGHYATPSVLEEAILSHSSARRIAVAAAAPGKIYESLAKRLFEKGFCCSVRDSILLAETHFGKALRLASVFCGTKGVLSGFVSASSDFLFNPFSGLSSVAAQEIDALIRSDRTRTADDVRGILRRSVKDFEYIEELLEQPDSFFLLGYFKDRARSLPGLDEASVHRECEAIGLYARVMDAASEFGLSASDCLDLAWGLGVSDARMTGEGCCRVEFMGFEDAAALAPSSVDVLLACNMTAEEFLPHGRSDVADEALSFLGLCDECTASKKTARTFALLSRVPASALYFEYCAKDECGIPLRPAAMLDAFLPQGEGEPCGEECVFSKLSSGRMVPERPGDFAGGSSLKGLPRPEMPVLSASQIERYLACPYAWFLDFRIRPRKIDEGFGPLEQGLFCREVLKGFYECFQDMGYEKVSMGSMDVALEVMEEVASECLEEQRFKDPSEGRFVSSSEVESKRADETIANLKGFMRTEASLLPSFTPRYFGYEIPCVPEAMYAGHFLKGTIDRIDVDERGRAVVIGYRPSVSKGETTWAPSASALEVRGAKLQTLIYAQVIRRVLGLEVVGALYVGYGEKSGVAGAAEASVLCSSPGVECDILSVSSCGYEDFSAYLDAVEERVGAALDGMRDFDVSPCPAEKSVCRHCSAPNCPERRES